MHDLLTDPTAVLVVGPRSAAVDALRTSTDEQISDVVVVDSEAGAIEALSDRRDIGCVVVAAPPTDSSIPAVCDRLHEDDDIRPILVSPGGPPGATEARATAAGATEIVLDEGDLPDRVAAAIERYDRQRDIAAESSMFRTLLDGVDGALYAKDRAARHIKKSQTPGDFSPEEFIGKTDIDVYGESANTIASYEDDRSVVESGDPIRDKEISVVVPDGTRWFRTTKLPWVEDGEIVGLIGWTRDVTEEVERRKRLERHDERLERFVRSIRHDVKSPLQVASGRISMAAETGTEEYLHQAQAALTRIEEILDDLSEIALEDAMLTDHRADDGSSEPVSLPALIDEVWELVGFESASLETTFGPEAVVNTPLSSVRPVLENLLKNAVDHAGREATVRIGPLESGGFFVADDGPGIPPDERDRVLQDGYTTSEGGTGTGLSIVTDVAEQRGWDLHITDSWAGGTRIELRNTLVVSDPSVPPVSGESTALTEGVDLGDVNVAGESTSGSTAGRWELAGSGKNIHGDRNECHYRCCTVEGPVRIEAQVVGLDGANEWSNAGVMVRDSLDEAASYGHLALTEDHGTKIDWRTANGADGTTQHLEGHDLDAPWYRIDRVGDTLTLSYSPDGDSWQPLDQRRISLADPVTVGLTVCSVQPNELARATVENVSVVPLDPSQAQ